MKKYIFMAVAAIAALSSCNSEDLVNDSLGTSAVKEAPTFTATIEGASTRTALGEGNKVQWVSGDEVLLLMMGENGLTFSRYNATPAAGDATTATLSYGSTVYGESSDSDELFRAFYPVSVLSVEDHKIVFPATQTYDGDDISFAPMVGSMDSESSSHLTFQNAAALLKITVPGSEMTKLTSVTVSSDHAMNGPADFEFPTDSYGTYLRIHPVAATPENSKIRLDIPSGITIPEDGSKTFFIAILPLLRESTNEAPAPKYGYLQIDVTNGTTTKTMRTTKAGGIEIDRNKIYPITFKENIVAWEKPLSLGRGDYGGPTSVVIETGIDVSSHVIDTRHKPLNDARTLWEVLDGKVLRIQTSASKIKAPVNSSRLFMDYYKVASITGLNKLDTSAVTNMSMMFNSCNALTELDLSNFDTSSVTNMSAMFMFCVELKSLDISSFVTSSVTDMSEMFWYCNALTELDVTHFVTSNVTNMLGMFGECNRLATLDVSHFDTSNVTNMISMFNGCNALAKLDISNFDTRKVRFMYSMFMKCNKLSSLTFGGNFSMQSVLDKEDMFVDCGSGLYSWNKCTVHGVSDSDLQEALKIGTGWNDEHMAFAND